MGRIRVLPDNVANKIAAGEVVERPASVVKELLENSLDAGSSEVRIEVESGGRRLIRVADDGCGMLRDDAMLAFERHATSKLQCAEDLLHISTLGFRGEALPSIASVSRLVLETRSREEDTGTRVEVAGGRMLSCDEMVRAPGTSVTVRDLFYNVPARKKFLRTDQTELAHIASLVTHYSLAYPDKTFELRHAGNELLRVAPVETLRERVYQVFGASILEDLVDLGVREKEVNLAPGFSENTGEEPGQEEGEDPGLRVFCVRGMVSRPQVQKLNRNSIFLFVNGRLIRDRILMHALTSAYHNLIPPGCFPFALVFLECDAREVDVNVHPSKTEVRFRHAGLVHDFVRDAIREALMESRPAPSFPVRSPSPPQPAADLPYSDFTQQVEEARLAAPPGLLPEEPGGEQLPEFHLASSAGSPMRFDFSGAKHEGGADPSTSPYAPVTSLPAPDTHRGFPEEDALAGEPGTMNALRELRPLGQVRESFIVAVGRDGLWIIDQHVAHERILFERLLRASASSGVDSQRLLTPIILQVSPAQVVEHARIAMELHRMGFETELFGQRTIAVKAAPAGISAADIEKLLFEVLEISDRHLRGVSLEDLRRVLAASVACRAAIKINTPLDRSKMEWLLEELAATACPMSCPHGRPVALRYSMREILKGFHRI